MRYLFVATTLLTGIALANTPKVVALKIILQAHPDAMADGLFRARAIKQGNR